MGEELPERTEESYLFLVVVKISLAPCATTGRSEKRERLLRGRRAWNPLVLRPENKLGLGD